MVRGDSEVEEDEKDHEVAVFYRGLVLMDGDVILPKSCVLGLSASFVRLASEDVCSLSSPLGLKSQTLSWYLPSTRNVAMATR